MTKQLKMEEIQKLIDQHEVFKLKGLEMWEDDMFKRIELKEKMRIKAIELKSQILEMKSEIDKDEKLRFLDLKNWVDETWKKITEKTIDSQITLEFKDRRAKLNALSKYRELLYEYAENVIEYVNVIKLSRKNDLPF